MKALTFEQPHAWAVMCLGGKTITNQPRNTRYRGEFWVHAGQHYSETDADWMQRECGLMLPNPDQLQFEAILGTVELVDVTQDAREWSPWALPGFYHWMLRYPEPLPQPIPNVRGKQGWWNYPREHHREYRQFYAYKPDDPGFIKAWPGMVADARRIIDHARDEYGLNVGPGMEGVEGHADADTSEQFGIWLNGATPAVALEPLLIWGPGEKAIEERLRSQRGWLGNVDYVWMVCKTGRLPYDAVVCAVLLRCHMLAPRAFAIGSDGEWDREWQNGAQDGMVSPRLIYRECFGRELKRDPLVDTPRGPPAAKKRPPIDDDDGEPL